MQTRLGAFTVSHGKNRINIADFYKLLKHLDSLQNQM